MTKSGKKASLRWCGAVATLAVLGAVCGPVRAADMPAGEPVGHRISAEQYRTIVADVFGADIKVGGRFEPGKRQDGLLAIGAGDVGVTTAGLEQYDSMARAVASQVVDESHRDELIPCKPASATGPDDACVGQFLSKVGRLLYRRPLSPQELATHINAASGSAKALKNFYAGLSLALGSMLESPQFLFRTEAAEPDPDHTGQYRLTGFSKASRLSFFLWNAAPDDELLAAAERGDLNSQKGLSVQVERMLKSPRLETGVRAFFVDMLGFDEFETLSKDAMIYPKFTTQVARDAKEQTMRTIVDLLLTHDGDYRDLFTTGKTFLTPVLGSLYSVPVADDEDAPNGAPPDWLAYEYPAGDPRAGILMQASFAALHSHPGRSSPTIRGKALREIVLCQKVPDPPANVNFTVVQDTKNPMYRTARDRVTAHRNNPVCAGCHKLIDPMGLAMENFDGAGSFRTTENGAAIDASGELDGVAFKDGIGLGKAVHDSPATTACLVNRAYTYGVGRAATKGETEWVKTLEKDFAADSYRFPALLRRIATSDEFYRVAAPRTGANDTGTGGSKLASDANQAGERR